MHGAHEQQGLPHDPSADQLKFRELQRRDGAALHRLIAACPPLDLNSIYAYLLLCLHHSQTSVVAEIDGQIVGTVTATYRRNSPTRCLSGRSRWRHDRAAKKRPSMSSTC
ncbi:hypothetical protein ACVBEH_19100 [Roseateles sp. GG27B]